MAWTFDAQAYGPVFAEFLVPERLPPLGPGQRNREIVPQLESATNEKLFAHARIADPDMADACRAGLWLYHDDLDESHTISQGINTPTGSYWHGLMHRREPDFGNSKYWFRRVGQHPVFEPLAVEARRLAQAESTLSDAAWLADIDAWDPFSFIDLCEACCHDPGPDHELCRRVALAEWQMLFDYSYRKTTGAD